MPSVGLEDVVLESPAVLAQLLEEWPTPPSRRNVQEVHREAHRLPRPQRICSCGACPRCRDNARWNRIFDEKFADPSYYGQITIRYGSSLATA